MTARHVLPTLTAILATVLMALAAGQAARADQIVVLRPNIQVEGDYVRLGDLFVDAGSAADEPVFRSPEPGSSGTVSADRLIRAARAHGLVWENAERHVKVSVGRPGIEIGLDEIAAAIRDEIVREFNSSAEHISYAIDFANGSSPLSVATTAEPEVEVSQMRFNERTGRFSASITISDGRTATTRETYSGRAVRVRLLPVLVRPIARGEIIGPGDVDVREVPSRNIPGDTIVDTASLVGMAARRALRTDRPLRERDVEPPRIVQRNTTVVATYTVPGLTITVRARALDDGALGDTVRVLNLQSNRVIETIVIGTNLVEAMPSNAAVAVATN